jgi:4-hydroxybutyrate dehydrogenase
MKQLNLSTTLHKFDTCKEFAEEFKIDKNDLIITNEYIFKPYFGDLNIEAQIIYQEKYGQGEPSDDMFEAMYKDIKGEYKRIIGIGGGTIIDISKIFALKYVQPFLDLMDKKLEIKKDKELILIPTTCGTGSEVTNVSVFALNSRNTKMGLADDELYADHAVLIPELLKGLPFRFFATSSIDALIHAVESSLSPKATPYSKLFGYKAIEMIIKGYQKIAAEGEEARFELLSDFLLASNYAGIAFGTAGCAAVHAMSYALSGTFHVAHGEANYAMFTGVLKNYMEIKRDGEIAVLNNVLANLLNCSVDVVYDELEKLLNNILKKKSLSEYGATEELLVKWTESTMKTQGRLMANNFVELDAQRVHKIFKELL